MVPAYHLLASLVKIVSIGSRYLTHLLLLRHLSVAKVAQCPFNFVNFPRYDLSRLLLIDLSLHSFLHGRESPCKKFLRHLHIVLVFRYQTELRRVVVLGLVEVDDNFLSQSGKNTDTFATMHHSDDRAVLKNYLDWFVTVGCEFSQVRYLHLLIDLILASSHQCRFWECFFCVWLSLALIILWYHKVRLIENDIWIDKYFLNTDSGQRRLSRVSHRKWYCLTGEWTEKALFLKVELIVRQKLTWVLDVDHWIVLVNEDLQVYLIRISQWENPGRCLWVPV